jgi:hypothetical protein
MEMSPKATAGANPAAKPVVILSRVPAYLDERNPKAIPYRRSGQVRSLRSNRQRHTPSWPGVGLSSILAY